MQVPEGHCWVNGDNLDASRDSRIFGPLPLALVRGKVLAAWGWPRRLRWIKSALEDAEWLHPGQDVQTGGKEEQEQEQKQDE